MRALLLGLIGGVVALAAISAACGEDEVPQVQPSQQAQEQTQPEQPAEQSAATQTADQTATAQGQQQTQESEVEQGEPANPLLAEARDAYEAWSAALETMEAAVSVDYQLGDLSTQVASTSVVQLEPLMALITIDASSLLAMVEDFGGGDLTDGLSDTELLALEALLRMQILAFEDAAYLTMPLFGGWVDLSDQSDEGLSQLAALIETNPDALANLGQVGQLFDCVETVDGSISEGIHEGQTAWFVECLIDLGELSAADAERLLAPDIILADAGVETMRMRMIISQSSGAPLLIETEALLSDGFALLGGDSEAEDDQSEFYVSTALTLLSWNEPVVFPTPEPLVEETFLDDFTDTPGGFGFDDEPAELLSPEQLLELTSSWAAHADELRFVFFAQAVIDGESRSASTSVSGSRTRGAFETIITIDEASRFRMHWNRDGIWTSDSEQDGQPIWTASSPALLGFAGMTVDQFLADPDRLNLDLLRDLLEISWLTRTIEGGMPPVYELVIESGPLAPGDPLFDEIVTALKVGTAELLAESVEVESIERYSTILTIRGDEGELGSQVTTAEFQTDAGLVELLTNLTLFVDEPIVFSVIGE